MEMNEPLISVLMVNYNHQSSLPETVGSVLNQTYQNIQFIIVDDGSTDCSPEILKSYRDERIELYCRKENEHICVATNFGFTKVRGEYLARIDSDDLWASDKLEKQFRYFQENPQCRVCFTRCDIIDEKGKIVNEKESALCWIFDTRLKSQAEYLYYFFVHGNCLAHSSVLMKTDVMKEIGFFSVGYRQLHDFDYWVRIVKRYRIDVMSEKLTYMRRFGENVSGEVNASASTVENDTRTYNEQMQIRAHFFEDMSKELFIETFGRDFLREDSFTEEELQCEKAFLLCGLTKTWKGIAPAGLEQMMMLLNRQETRELLKEKYNFDAKAFYTWMASKVYYDPIVAEELEGLREMFAEAQRIIRYMENKIEEMKCREVELLDENRRFKETINVYENSTSWKVTKPLRNISSRIKG